MPQRRARHTLTRVHTQLRWQPVRARVISKNAVQPVPRRRRRCVHVMTTRWRNVVLPLVAECQLFTVLDTYSTPMRPTVGMHAIICSSNLGGTASSRGSTSAVIASSSSGALPSDRRMAAAPFAWFTRLHHQASANAIAMAMAKSSNEAFKI